MKASKEKMKENKYVFCFVFDERGRVLVLRRAEFMRARPNEWDLPGGKVDPGEDMSVAVLRELKEETGIEATTPELVLQKGGEWQDEQHVFAYYRTNVLQPQVTLSEEHTAFEWHEPLVAATMVEYRPHLMGLEQARAIVRVSQP